MGGGDRDDRPPPPRAKKMACFIHYFSCVILCILFICRVKPHQFNTVSVKRIVWWKGMIIGGGGAIIWGQISTVSEYMGQPCPGSDCICKGAISGHLNYITRISISGFVAASCCFSSRVGAFNYTASQSVEPLSTKWFVKVFSNDTWPASVYPVLPYNFNNCQRLQRKPELMFLSRRFCNPDEKRAGASFQLFLGGPKIFLIFQCHRTIEKLEKNSTLYVVIWRYS